MRPSSNSGRPTSTRPNVGGSGRPTYVRPGNRPNTTRPTYAPSSGRPTINTSGKKPIVITHPAGQSPLLSPGGSRPRGGSRPGGGIGGGHDVGGSGSRPGWDDGRHGGGGGHSGGGHSGGGRASGHGSHGGYHYDDWHDDSHRWYVSWYGPGCGWGFSFHFGNGYGRGGWGWPTCGHRYYHTGCGYCSGYHGHSHYWWWPNWSFWCRPYEPWRAYAWYGPQVEVRTVYVDRVEEPVYFESAEPAPVTIIDPAAPSLIDAWSGVRAGDIAGAHDQFLSILASVPYESEARAGYAITSALLGHEGAAIGALRQVAAEDVVAFEFVPNDGRVQDALRGVIDVFTSRVARAHEDIDAWFALGATRLMLGEPATAYFATSNALERGDVEPSTQTLHMRLREILYGEFVQ